MSEPWQTVLALLAGVVTGTLSGAFGVGGAVISTPAIRALGATPLEGVGSTLPSIIPSAISGTLRYRREGLVVWWLVVWTAAPGIVAAVGGSLLAEVVPGGGHPLMIVTATLLAITAVRTGSTRSPRERPVGDDPAFVPHPRARAITVGVAAGGISGLLGVGGGVLMVPAFSGWLHLDIKRAVATSLCCVGILAVPGAITHALLGNVNWGFAIPLSIGVVPGARLGASLTIASTDRALRLCVAIVLGTIALLYGALEIAALL